MRTSCGRRATTKRGRRSFPRYVDEDAAVNLVLSIDPGPRVEIVFQGDPLGASDRDRLVPIAREHSVDEDLLEDSKFGIERHFRERGYCNPARRLSAGDAEERSRVQPPACCA